MADIVRWEPVRESTSLRSAIDRLFEESFLRPGIMSGGSLSEQMLPVDVIESNDRIVVQAAVPGVKGEDIEVTLTGDLLTIKGEFRSEKREEQAHYWRQERHFGSFCRRIGLPADIDADKVEASFENGLLTLVIPKAESVKLRTIPVTSK